MFRLAESEVLILETRDSRKERLGGMNGILYCLIIYLKKGRLQKKDDCSKASADSYCQLKYEALSFRMLVLELMAMASSR